jgi:molybdopterin biosynthesis enzyme MoaB
VCADGRLERTGRLTKASSGVPQLGTALSHSVALVIIGDEILNGKVRDENIMFLTAELHALGWRVARCVVLPDDEDVIARCGGAVSSGNVPYACRCHAAVHHGAPDQCNYQHLSDACREVQQAQGLVEVVITCGGIGPTADDRTMAALASAAGVHLAANAELTAMLQAYFGKEVCETNRAHTGVSKCGMAGPGMGAGTAEIGPARLPFLAVQGSFGHE